MSYHEVCGVGGQVRGEPVQRVVQVGDGLALAVGLLGQVVVGVVLVVFAERGREIGLCDAAKGVISERRLVAARVGDAGEVAFGVVGVVRDMARRVGDVESQIMKLESKAPPVTRRDRWATRKFKGCATRLSAASGSARR
jgi:hypothetical protein